MTSEDFRKLVLLSEMRRGVDRLRTELGIAGLENFFHIEEVERLVADCMAEPAHPEFSIKVKSIIWHLEFAQAELDQLKEQQ